MFRKAILILMFLVSFSILSGDSFGLTIGPSRFEVSLPAGDEAGADYYVQNEQDDPVSVIVEPENWFKNEYIYGNIKIEDWVEFDVYKFDLKPKEIKKLRLTIRVPEDVTGELVAQIFFSAVPKGEDGKEKTGGVQARLGAVLYVAIKGTEIVDAEIQDMKIAKPEKSALKEFHIKVKVKNEGNVHIRPKGNVVIKDAQEETVADLQLAYGRATLPKSSFEYYAFWKDPKPGEYRAKATIDYGHVFDYDKAVDLEKTATFEKSFRITGKGEVEMR